MKMNWTTRCALSRKTYGLMKPSSTPQIRGTRKLSRLFATAIFLYSMIFLKHFALHMILMMTSFI